jgi:hypothetical protein
MSELKLREFADTAERLVELPDLADLERRGRSLQVRRRVAVVAAAVALAVLGGLLARSITPKAIEPVHPVKPEIGQSQPYPGNQMRTLEPGTYELHPSSVSSEPTALVTLPRGWNDWEGPNRFNGHRPGDPTIGRYNEPALTRATWYVGVLVVKLVAVANRVCERPLSPDDFVHTYDEIVAAMTHLPGYRITEGPTRLEAFGRPATHLRYRQTGTRQSCPDDTTMMTATNGGIGGEENMDVWVVDVEGVPLTVFKSWNGDVPARIAAELDAVVESVEFVVAD